MLPKTAKELSYANDCLSMSCLYTHELLNNLLDELTERVGWVLNPDVMDELGYDFRVGFTFETVAPMLQQDLYVFVVCDDS